VDTPLTEDLPLSATTRKGAVRAQMWRELEDAHRAGRINAVAARAADFYGPHVTESMLGERFMEPLLHGKKAELIGDPTRLHTVTYVPDLAAAMVRLGADRDAWGQAWHVPNAPTVTAAELVALTARAMGVEPAFKTVPKWQLRLVGPFIPGAKEIIELFYEFDHDFVVDDSKFVNRYGRPGESLATPLTEGLASTVAWYRTQLSR
jgi:nucleoside-diphosphate-sugar epimerase